MELKEYIPWIISGTALLFTILTYNRNGKNNNNSSRENELKKAEEKGKQDQLIISTLESLKEDIKEIKETMIKESTIATIQAQIKVLNKAVFGKSDQTKEGVTGD